MNPEPSWTFTLLPRSGKTAWRRGRLLAERPPIGPDWVHDFKHDGYRLMARREPVSAGIRLLTRNEHDWTSRYSLIVQAVALKARSCLRHRGNDQGVVLIAFDLLQVHFALGDRLVRYQLLAAGW